MKAVQLVGYGRPLEERDIDIPGVGDRDVLVRVKAAGICHSDVHYRAGKLGTRRLPLTLGHEVAGVVEQAGKGVSTAGKGDRVCLHYLATCGNCVYCNAGKEQSCTSGLMIGKQLDGGYAEYICVPERSVRQLPDAIPFDQGAIMMCSAATALHALNQSRVRPGETVAVWGLGGLGVSAVQLARLVDAERVFAVEINPDKLAMAERYGAIPIDACSLDPVDEIIRHTNGLGVDVALELVGLSLTMEQAVRSLAVSGRAVVAGLDGHALKIDPYKDLLSREAEIIGASDHVSGEIPRLMEWVEKGDLVLADVISRSVPLAAGDINVALDNLERYNEDFRVVITP